MLLTLKPPLQSDFQRPSAHVYSPPRSEPIKLHSPPDSKGGPLPSFSDTQPQRMSTPHRLPPPLGLTLPNPAQDRGPPPPPPSSLTQSQPMGQLPAPPTSQWQGTEEAMRSWLVAKAEEDKRKQEEEKTRQETLKLEQRKIEQSMLRESLQGGVPPHMVPMVFVGMGGPALANANIEWAQQYISQLSLQGQPQQQHQQQQQGPPLPQQQQSQYSQQQQQPPLPLPPARGSPDIRRDRAIAGPQPNPYAQHQPPPPPTSAPSMYAYERMRSNSQTIQAAPGPTSAPRAGLARLNTGDMQIHQPPQPGSTQMPMQHSSQHGHHPPPQQQEQAHSTPTSIYFHHWVPPNNNNKDPGTPSDYAHSPKKRKTNLGHGKTPETSPSFAQLSSAGRRNRAHSLQQSETSYSSRRSNESHHQTSSRPSSRHRRPSNLSEAPELARRGSSQPETANHSSRSRQASAGSEQRKRGGSGTPKREAEEQPSQ